MKFNENLQLKNLADIWNFSILKTYEIDKTLRIEVIVYDENRELVIKGMQENLKITNSPFNLKSEPLLNPPVYEYYKGQLSKQLKKTGNFTDTSYSVCVKILESTNGFEYNNLCVPITKIKNLKTDEKKENDLAEKKQKFFKVQGDARLMHDFSLNDSKESGLYFSSNIKLDILNLPVNMGVSIYDRANPQVQNSYFSFDYREYLKNEIAKKKQRVTDSLNNIKNSALSEIEFEKLKKNINSLNVLREHFIDSLKMFEDILKKQAIDNLEKSKSNSENYLKDSLQNSKSLLEKQVLDSLQRHKDSVNIPDSLKMMSNILKKHSDDSLQLNENLLKKNISDSINKQIDTVQNVYEDAKLVYAKLKAKAEQYRNKIIEINQSVEDEVKKINNVIKDTIALMNELNEMKGKKDEVVNHLSFFKHLQFISVGQFYTNISDLSIWGQNLKGCSFSVEKNGLLIDGIYGTLNKQNLNKPSVKTIGLGIGGQLLKKEGLIKVFVISQKESEIKNFDFNMNAPRSNYLLGGIYTLPFSKRIYVNGELFGSTTGLIDKATESLNLILNQENKDNNTTGWGTKNKVGVSLWRHTDIELELEKISNQYESFGNEYLRSGMINKLFRVRQGLFENRVRLTIEGLNSKFDDMNQTNLNKMKYDVLFDFIDIPKIQITYQPLKQQNEMMSFKNEIFTANITHVIKKEIKSHIFQTLYLYQQGVRLYSSEKFIQKTSNYIFSYTYIPDDIFFVTSFAKYICTDLSDQKVSLGNVGSCIGFKMFKKISNTITLGANIFDGKVSYVSNYGIQFNILKNLLVSSNFNLKVYKSQSSYITDDMFNRFSVIYKF